MKFETNEKKIRDDISAGIRQSLYATFASYRRTGIPDEPDFVAELVERMPATLYSSLSAYMPQYQYSISGVFCHQKPLAKFGTGKRPEVGDILFAYIEENKYGIKKCNALLLQAKKTSAKTYYVGSNEEHQLKLYEEWPKFELERAGAYSGTIIDVQPKTLNTGAQYLLLQYPYKDEKKVCCAYPDKELIPEKKLADQIVDLMRFSAGRTFEFENGFTSEDGWTKLVWHLLKMSMMSKFNRKASGRVDEGRYSAFGPQGIMEYIEHKMRVFDDWDFEDAGACVLIYAKEENRDDGWGS